ncbi:uncharacterized protein LOC121997146 [Zingiber officinale]|uniref:Uncharacterized protein n=1 Tax=Zingiber officinale TaxID=94328 RepID=A0A8J5GCJ9_ZINOF|nr:uncharacterized protein LOC121997146 [Zingiber officinale]XP_042407341.1 uncharacterized protein LOC121997146 [Zingiber officinale]KAG6500554.1 hypothetical protein ZIOFF_040402 [Zingiber officinale]
MQAGAMSEHEKKKYKKKKQLEDNGMMDGTSSSILEEHSGSSLVENQVALKKHKKKKTKNLMSEGGRGVSNGKFETDGEKDVEEAEIEQHGSQDGKKKRRKARDGDGGGSEASKGEEYRKRKQGDDGLVILTVDTNMKKRRKDRDGDRGGSEAPKAEENWKRKQRDGDLVNLTVDTNIKKRKKDNVLKVSALSTGPTAGEVSGDKNSEGGKVAAADSNIVCDSGRDKMENVKVRRKKNDKKLENPHMLEIRDAERAMAAENEVSTNHDKLHISVDKAKMKVKKAHDTCEFKVDSHETCTNGNQSLGMEVWKEAQEISEMPSATTILNRKRKKSKKDENTENQEAEKDSENILKDKDKQRKPIQAAEVEGNKETSSVRKEKATDDSEVCSSKNKKCFKNGSDVSSLKKKKVSFSSEVEVFPYGIGSHNEENEENAEMPIIQGKRFTKEEDQKILEAIDDYIKAHQLGAEGMHMILHCRDYPEVKNCWRVIEGCLPNRRGMAIYYRAHVLLERGKSKWEPEDYEALLSLYSKYGPKWKKIAHELGRHRVHVKDTWRSIRSPHYRKGTWSQEEYQTLFDLVNMDLRLKVFEEKSAKNYMLRDNISWDVISQKLVTRFPGSCCLKWYQQLVSPLVKREIWNDRDDYLLVDALRNLDACCYEDVDWDNLLEHRPGAVCQRRWTEMVRFIGMNKVRPFIEQVEVLSKRYCSEMIEYRQ